MTIVEALENALTFLEAAGFRGGDIHDDLVLAITQLQVAHPRAAHAPIPVRSEW